MIITKIPSAKIVGIQGVETIVEVGIQDGLGIHVVGLVSSAVKSSLMRTMTALQSQGFRIPGKKIVINIAPADLHKSDAGYDLPIAVGVIAASGQRELPLASKFIIVGELGLDGSLRPVRGAVAFAQLAVEKGYEGIILPAKSALEVADFHDIAVYGAESLADALRILSGEDCQDLLACNSKKHNTNAVDAVDAVDLCDIPGHEFEKRALEIAAAGGHNLLMLGSPGTGKGLLAKALVGILPPMSREEALQIRTIYSVKGNNNRLDIQRPFRSPHFSASLAAMLGGGPDLEPGEVTLANGGVLYLNEMGEMPKSVLEALRVPIEDHKVCLCRLKGKVEYPSSFMLVAASNLCPCGYWGVDDRCTCTPSQRKNYMDRLSGPVMDHLDIQIAVSQMSQTPAASDTKPESSSVVAERVEKAREIQRIRFADETFSTNAEMDSKLINKYCPLDEQCKDTLQKTVSMMNLLPRAYSRIVKLARTIADLEGSKDIKPEHLVEASVYRYLDKVS